MLLVTQAVLAAHQKQQAITSDTGHQEAAADAVLLLCLVMIALCIVQEIDSELASTAVMMNAVLTTLQREDKL